MKRIFLATLMILCSSFLFAQKFEAICETGQTLKYSISDENAVVISSSGYYGNIVIPSTVTYNNHQYNVTSIGESAFNNCTSLTSITIPESVTSIGMYAFEKCTGLKSVTIPESVISIGDCAFMECRVLTSITIPEGVTSIGKKAFRGVANINYFGVATESPWGALAVNGTIDGDFVYSDVEKTKLNAYIGKGGDVSIPENVMSISSSAFEYCYQLTSITIPESVTSIGDNAFSHTGLTSITIPESVTSIGSSAFEYCYQLTSITIPKSVTSIYGVFHCCFGLTSIIIPESVTSIGSFAFASCSHLTSITIPESVTSIGWDAFSGCTSLTSITIPESVTSIGWGAFSECTSLTSITIPESVTSIGSSAFEKCTGLKSVTIPESVTSIGSSAFKKCTGLKSVTIYGAPSIELGAFWNCTGLKNITCYAQKVPSCTPFFPTVDEKMYDSVILYVPCSCLQDYQNDKVFGKFSHIECIAEETILQSNDVIFEPETYSADFSFPKIESVASYELTIKKGDEFICSLTFNADGVFQGINFSELKSDFAGFKFNVTGLTPATTYNYLLQGKSESNVVLKEFSGTFTTQGTATGISSTEFPDSISIVNNQILVNGIAPEYVITVLGQKVANQNLQTGIYFVVVDGQNLKVSIP